MVRRVITAVENFKEYYKANKKVKPFDYRTLNRINEYTLQYAMGYIFEYKNKFIVTHKGGGWFNKKSEVDPLISKILELLNTIFNFEKAIDKNIRLSNKKKKEILDIFRNRKTLLRNHKDLDIFNKEKNLRAFMFKKYANSTVKIDIPRAPTYRLTTYKNTGGRKVN